jgi:hypothetical protein
MDADREATWTGGCSLTSDLFLIDAYSIRVLAFFIVPTMDAGAAQNFEGIQILISLTRRDSFWGFRGVRGDHHSLRRIRYNL